MDEDAISQFLNRYERFGVHLGLERIQRLLAALDNPQQRVQILHVAGTNGKGSVCAYLSSVLVAAGYRVGRYTSPHLVTWRERICINNAQIPAPDLMQVLEQVEAAIAPDQECPTQFEVITAAAWLYFAQQAVDIAVIEVGLGGRLDATNVVDLPLVSIITSLSREHWQRLGPTLADIAWEKAGILKSERPAVIGPLLPVADVVVEDRARQLNCPLTRVVPAAIDADGYAVYGTSPSEPPLKYRLPCPGDHQLTNSAIAITALYCLRSQGWPVPDEAIQTGIARTRWPGRLQWLTWQDPSGNAIPWLIDGAHNTEAATALRSYVDTLLDARLSPLEVLALQERGVPYPVKGAVTWLMGMLSTKDHADVFRALLRPGDRLHLVPVPGHASMEPEALAAIALDVCPKLSGCDVHGDLPAGLRAAAVASSLRILCGSLYLVGHFFQTQSPTDMDSDH